MRTPERRPSQAAPRSVTCIADRSGWLSSRLPRFPPRRQAAGCLRRAGSCKSRAAAGGGLTPWALIAGLGTNRETGISASCTRVEPQDFSLDSCSVALGIRDRVELSYARQAFDLGDVVAGESIHQSITGFKLRLLGDAVFDQDRWRPQLTLGMQYKSNSDFDFVPRRVGARHASDFDIYLAATKVYLAGPFSRTWLLNATLRATRANQLGILGFGGDRSDAAVLRQKAPPPYFCATRWCWASSIARSPTN